MLPARRKRPPKRPICWHCDTLTKTRIRRLEQPGLRMAWTECQKVGVPTIKWKCGVSRSPKAVIAMETICILLIFRVTPVSNQIHWDQTQYYKPHGNMKYVHILMISMHGMYNQNSLWNPDTFLTMICGYLCVPRLNDNRNLGRGELAVSLPCSQRQDNKWELTLQSAFYTPCAIKYFTCTGFFSFS